MTELLTQTQLVAQVYLPSPLSRIPRLSSACPTPSRKAMAKNYQELWERSGDASVDKTKAVQALAEIVAEIVADIDGRTFILGLEPEAVKLCLETLDYVGCDLHLLPFAASSGLARASQTTSSKPPTRGTLSS